MDAKVEWQVRKLGQELNTLKAVTTDIETLRGDESDVGLYIKAKQIYKMAFMFHRQNTMDTWIKNKDILEQILGRESEGVINVSPPSTACVALSPSCLSKYLKVMAELRELKAMAVIHHSDALRSLHTLHSLARETKAKGRALYGPILKVAWDKETKRKAFYDTVEQSATAFVESCGA